VRPPSILGLYWSIRGEVACDEHAPATDDPRWTSEGWTPIPLSSADVKGMRYQCQHCAADGRAITHHNGNLH
jgi:hypothetical protein